MDKIKILIVDDEADFLRLISERIESWGYHAMRASDGKAAIEAVKNRRPDVVILDYLMPDMDGVAVLRKIREMDKELPVIMFTAYPDAKAMEEVADMGISAFIPKLSLYSDVQSSLKSAIELICRKLNKK